ncbi:phosphoglycolate phosphatase [Winogradskyella arenosi]|uniref:phosphoglycolate phosphatase n=1 Tax=Winogradskyella arenosi TaxID=533325 RepID=A0A368ZHN8_9FLAO|nr:phosphoglycolate phosphatase [Winogradskyella arenosi]RCW92369.1 phosphoglycolate phosphatase [Winogradskyella arenosi]
MDFTEKKLIIFDFDGTLINSIPDLTAAVNIMLSHFKAKPLSIAQVTPFIGNGAQPLVQRALEASFPKDDLTESLFEDAFTRYLEAYKSITCKDTFMYPGVLDTLNYLDQKGYSMVICTNKPYAYIAPILEALEIKSFFKLWVGEDSLPEKKPSAMPLLHLTEAMGTSIAHSVMVGDSKNDILAAQNAGMQSIGVSYGYNYNENISDYNPTVVADQFTELQDLF